MKNIFCLFERPFKIQKNGVFLFELSFFVLEILTFDDDLILFASKNVKILNKRYLWKYQRSVLETRHHKCASQTKQNDTLNGVAIAPLSAPVSFCPKNKYQHLQRLKWDQGCYLEQTQFPYCLNSHQQIVWGRWLLVYDKTGNFSF